MKNKVYCKTPTLVLVYCRNSTLKLVPPLLSFTRLVFMIVLVCQWLFGWLSGIDPASCNVYSTPF